MNHYSLYGATCSEGDDLELKMTDQMVIVAEALVNQNILSQCRH